MAKSLEKTLQNLSQKTLSTQTTDQFLEMRSTQQTSKQEQTQSCSGGISARPAWWSALRGVEQKNLMFVWNFMCEYYGARFASKNSKFPTQVWALSLAEVPREYVGVAIKKICQGETDFTSWPPTPGEFRNLCAPEVDLKCTFFEKPRLSRERQEKIARDDFLATQKRFGFGDNLN